MNVNSVVFGQIIFLINITVIAFTIYYTRSFKKDFPCVTLLAVLFNFILPPVGWVYCWYRMNIAYKHKNGAA
ncbi:hypothetical protein GCM10007391_26910 [Alteromonas halophila]|uniref:Superinfection immunity protein n=1 Tax=Alteromonas halophila TaxID=516698 RepID=A0A918JMZ9_9ALTE|nr:hypothetical protein GCM10007391_26910 [Alteromonas halophila]